MKVPAVRKDSDEIVEIDVEDILYIQAFKNRIYLQTETETFIAVSTLEHWLNWLKQFGFDKLDRSYIAQVDKIKTLDTQWNVAYFDDKNKKDAISVPVAATHVPRIEKYLKERKERQEES